jgi:hypothetical protein
VGAPWRVEKRWLGATFFSRPYSALLMSSPFLAFFYVFYGEAQLFTDLVVGITVEIGDASVDVEDDGKGAKGVLARFFFVVEKAFR